MPPKNNSKSNAKGANKKKGNDDDFDAMLAAAVKATTGDAVKNHINANAAGNGKAAGGPVHVSLAAREVPVPSSANHPENPYPVPTADKAVRQTWPEPTVPVSKQYPDGQYPAGQVMNYDQEFNTWRHSDAEKRALEMATEHEVQELRRAAEVHRQVRMWAQSWVKPGISLMLLTDRIEKKLHELIEKDGLKAGQAFPTGCSLNHVAAHYTPNSGDKVVLNYDDVMKIDFGTHVNGRIIDCAWTVAFNQQFSPLLDAVREATNEGIKQAGIDVRLGDIGSAIEEVMESHEVEINGNVHTVRSIRNLSGHSIAPYIIHGGKSVPIVKGGEQTKMEEGELFAIETFGSAGGRAMVVEDLECSHYMMNPGAETMQLRSDKAQQLLRHINKQYSTLAFCRKWLDRDGHDRHLLHLNHLAEQGAINKYPPLCDVKGSYTAQYEHTILLKPMAKEVLSRGNDY